MLKCLGGGGGTRPGLIVRMGIRTLGPLRHQIKCRKFEGLTDVYRPVRTRLCFRSAPPPINHHKNLLSFKNSLRDIFLVHVIFNNSPILLLQLLRHCTNRGSLRIFSFAKKMTAEYEYEYYGANIVIYVDLRCFITIQFCFCPISFLKFNIIVDLGNAILNSKMWIA